MRVSSCKFLRPPFVCFSKSSVGHYPPSTLELEDAQHVCASPAPVPDTSAELPSEEKIEVEKVDDVKVEMIMKSSFKKTDSGLNGVAKGRVKWMDFVGKELVEVKEFDARRFISMVFTEQESAGKIKLMVPSHQPVSNNNRIQIPAVT